MTVSTFDALKEELDRIRRRRRRFFTFRWASLSLIALIVLFTGMGLAEWRFQLSLSVRTLLWCALMTAVGVIAIGLLRAIRNLEREDLQLAHYVEDHFPDLQQRLLTSVECKEKAKPGVSSQLLDMLREDAYAKIQVQDLDRVTPVQTFLPAAVAAGLFLCVFGYTLFYSTGWMAAAYRILWPWPAATNDFGLSTRLVVAPGDIRIRRGDTVTIDATFGGTTEPAMDSGAGKQTFLWIQNRGEDWRRLAMKQGIPSNRYTHILPSIQKPFAYYVETGRDRSRTFQIAVFDPLRVERIDVEYAYPEYTGLKNKVETNGGDITAPEGTRITLRAIFNKPVDRARLLFQSGGAVELISEGTGTAGGFIVRSDDTYHIQAFDRAQLENENPVQYFVQAIADRPPELKLTVPGKDRRVMSIEEVPVAAMASDDYGLTRFSLHYSLAGGGDKEVSFMRKDTVPGNGAPEHGAVEGKALLYLEDLPVKPGDFITYYLSAADNNAHRGSAEVVSDIYFLEVVSTEEEFRKASPRGGMGGGGGGRMSSQQSSAMVENQKQIIAGTWKLLRQQKSKPDAAIDEEIQILAESQQRLLQRTQMSLRRLSERLSFTDESYDKAVTHLKRAATHMEQAVDKLTRKQLQDAITPETAALQNIMKSESESRVTQVVVSRMQQGAAGAGGQDLREREDLRSLFEMEMGRLENRYEMPPQADVRQQQMEEDSVFKKLRELARRQERLNRAQQALSSPLNQMSEEEKRRQLEQLRREQERLARDSDELSKQMSLLARKYGGRKYTDRQRQMDQVTRNMQDAARSLLKQEPDQAEAKGRKAMEQLKAQEDAAQRRSLGQLAETLGKKGEELKARENVIRQGLDRLVREPSKATESQMKNLLAGKETLQRQLADIEKLLREAGVQGKKERPEITEKAVDTLRMLNREGVPSRIEETRKLLQQGLLAASSEKEAAIEKSIGRIGDRLGEFANLSDGTAEQKLEEAAADSRKMREALEALRQQVDALQQKNASSLPGGNSQPSTGSDADAMRQGLNHVRQYARGLVQPWARGENWFVNARSIHRNVTQKEIEDFLNQPDFWKQLLDEVRELEKQLQTRAESSRSGRHLFFARDESIPIPYERLVEEYYRNLANATGGASGGGQGRVP